MFGDFYKEILIKVIMKLTASHFLPKAYSKFKFPSIKY